MIKHVVCGGIVGWLAGCVHAPIVVGMALTAPVSYPITVGAAGLIEGPTSSRLLNGLIGTTLGMCLVPWAPVNVLTAPVRPVLYAVVGAGIGAVIAKDKDK